MTRDRWLSVLARLTPHRPVDLDAVVFGAPREIAVQPPPVTVRPAPSPRLWTPGDPEVAYIGVRVTAIPADPLAVALKLAAAAVERGAIPVIFSTVEASGFERYGFRVERISGRTPAERQVEEDELCAFWNIAVVIDAADAERAG
jgi:hypothetical protein